MATNLQNRAEGSRVELAFDADAGTVSWTIDELGTGRLLPRAHVAYPRPRSLSGFPSGLGMRPWAMLYLHNGDQVTLNGYVEERVER